MLEHLSELPEAWQLAIRREKDSREYYARMAQSTSDASLKVLFESLAAEEGRHRERLESEYRRLFEADLDAPRGRTGVFEHALRTKAAPLISWQEWGEEAFRLAQELDVPILLSIGAVWCHWCHVMDQTTFGDPEVAALIDQNYVPIRVDNDMRPDINVRYNMGGWPTVAFLTPTGDVLTGGTYMPPAAFKETLRRVSEHYRGNRDSILKRATELRIERDEARAAAPADIGESASEAVFLATAGSYDEEFGGFGSAPKFPQADAIELLLARHRRTADSRPLQMATTTLKAMAQGGMYDHVAGGFFRYSTTRDWSIPHFEKMLEDNARLLLVYLHAYQLTSGELFRMTAEGVVSYVESTLRDPDTGCFRGSQDADEEYYSSSKAEREKRTAPFVDPVVHVSWNGMMASAYLEAAAILGRPELGRSALAGLRFLWRQCWQPERGVCHYWDGSPHLFGQLADQVWIAQAMLHAYEYGGNAEYLQHAEDVMRWAHGSLLMPTGAYRDGPDLGGAAGRLGQPEVPLTENAVAASALLHLHRLTGEGGFLDWAQAALRAFGTSYGHYGYFAASYALAVEVSLNDLMRVVVVGGSESPDMLNLLHSAWRAYAQNRALLTVDPVWETERLRKLGYPGEPTPAAYVCLGQTCGAPVLQGGDVAAAINDLYSKTAQSGRSGASASSSHA